MNTRNSKQTCWIDTHRVTLAEYEADISYHAEDLRQGRDASNPVPRVSMFAGKPVESDGLDNEARGLFWRGYAITLAWVVFCVVVMAYAPN